MSTKFLAFAQSSHDIKYYEYLASQGEDLEIISIHPYATYYIEKNNLSHKIIEEYFSEDEIENLYFIALEEAKDMICKFNNNVKNKKIDLNYSQYIDSPLISYILIRFYVLEKLYDLFEFDKIMINNVVMPDKSQRDKYLFFSNSPWIRVLKSFCKFKKVELNIFQGKSDSYEYPYTLLNRFKTNIKIIFPNFFLYKMIVKSHIRKIGINKNLQNHTILFLSNNGALSDLMNICIQEGYRVLYWDVGRNLYDPNNIYIYDSTNGKLRKIKFDQVQKIKGIINDEILNIKSECFYSDYSKINIYTVLEEKLKGMLNTENFQALLSVEQFKIISDLYNIDLTISLEPYDNYLKSILSISNTKHLSLLHGPQYSSHLTAQNIIDSFKKIKHIFVDGFGMEYLLGRYNPNLNTYKVGNIIYNYERKFDNKYDILYMTTKLDPINTFFLPSFNNNFYIKDSYKIIKYLNKNKNNRKICIKFKPMFRMSGLLNLPYSREIDKSIDVINDNIEAKELIAKSNVVLLDTFGTSLLQALSQDKIVVLYNRYRLGIDKKILSFLKKSVYYCDDINECLCILDSKSLNKKDTSIFLDYFCVSLNIDDIREGYKKNISKIIKQYKKGKQ